MDRLDQQNLRDDLQAVLALLQPRGAWTQHSIARTKHGNPCWPLTPNAFSWCLTGAIYRVTTFAVAPDLPHLGYPYEAIDRRRDNMIHYLVRLLPPCSYSPTNTLMVFNDHPTTNKRKVLNLLRRALRQLNQ